MCDKLLTTYNTNIVDLMIPDEKNFLLDVATKLKNTQKGNTTLISLINNKKSNTLRKIKYIGGPKTLSLYWNKEYEMTIYIFGEYHTNKGDCYKINKNGLHLEVEDFILDLVKNTPAFLDIYLEMPPFASDIEINNTGMSRIAHKLQKLDSVDNLIRLHSIDIRFGKSGLDDKTSALLKNLISIYESPDNKINLDDTSTKILKNLATFDLAEYKNYIVFIILNNKSVLKEINKSFLRDKILSFFTNNIIQDGLKYRELFRETIPVLFHDRISFLSSLEKILRPLIIINSNIVDIYTISRIFKSFDMTKGLRLKKVFQPKIPHNIIIYAGDAHSWRFRNFLDYIGTKKISHTGNDIPERYNDYKLNQNKVDSCIDLTNFPMPFFKNFPPK